MDKNMSNKKRLIIIERKWGLSTRYVLEFDGGEVFVSRKGKLVCEFDSKFGRNCVSTEIWLSPSAHDSYLAKMKNHTGGQFSNYMMRNICKNIKMSYLNVGACIL